MQQRAGQSKVSTSTSSAAVVSLCNGSEAFLSSSVPYLNKSPDGNVPNTRMRWVTQNRHKTVRNNGHFPVFEFTSLWQLTHLHSNSVIVNQKRFGLEINADSADEVGGKLILAETQQEACFAYGSVTHYNHFLQEVILILAVETHFLLVTFCILDSLSGYD